MSNFWKFMGGMLVGAAAGYVINEEFKKRRMSPPPVTGEKPKVNKTEPVKPNVDRETSIVKPKVDGETTMIENLIREYESNKNRTRQQNDTLDLLKIKLKQLKKM
jgi:hypothetical protein